MSKNLTKISTVFLRGHLKPIELASSALNATVSVVDVETSPEELIERFNPNWTSMAGPARKDISYMETP